jgi:hypothetical protein
MAKSIRALNDNEKDFNNEVLHNPHAEAKKRHAKFKNPPTKAMRHIDHIEQEGEAVKKFFIRLKSKGSSKNLIMSDLRDGNDYLALL